MFTTEINYLMNPQSPAELVQLSSKRTAIYHSSLLPLLQPAFSSAAQEQGEYNWLFETWICSILFGGGGAQTKFITLPITDS